MQSASVAAQASFEQSNPYTQLAAWTEHMLHARAVSYRTIAASLAISTIGGTAWAIATRSFRPLWAFSLAAPIFLIFLTLDATFVRRWRQDAASAWSRGAIDLKAFAGMLTANPILPKDTITGMLAGLPSMELARDCSSGERTAICDIMSTLSHCQVAAYALRTAAAFLLWSALPVAWAPDFWVVAVGTLVALTCWAAAPYAQRILFASLRRRQLRASSEGTDSRKRLFEVVIALDWNGIDGRAKTEYFDRLRRE
jgi:membrane protein implicated in regulation of membrane protease activity